MVELAVLRDLVGNGCIESSDGDSVLIRMPDGSGWRVYLREAPGEGIPSAAEILRTAVAVGEEDGTRDGAEPVEPPVETLKTIAKVAVIGKATGLYLTRELRSMGLERGDYVKITLERIKERGPPEAVRESVWTLDAGPEILAG